MSQPVAVAVHLAVADPSAPEPCFDHERLQVYQLALELDAELHAVLPRRGHRCLRDQLQRASLSVVANVAEGAGRVAPPDKRRFYAIARGSATETAALLDVLRARGVVTVEAYGQARHRLLRVVQMLSRLCREP